MKVLTYEKVATGRENNHRRKYTVVLEIHTPTCSSSVLPPQLYLSFFSQSLVYFAFLINIWSWSWLEQISCFGFIAPVLRADVSRSVAHQDKVVQCFTYPKSIDSSYEQIFLSCNAPQLAFPFPPHDLFLLCLILITLNRLSCSQSTSVFLLYCFY